MSTGGKTCPATTNNLGGRGPTRGPQEIRYRAVGSVDHRKIDLAVRLALNPPLLPTLTPTPSSALGRTLTRTRPLRYPNSNLKLTLQTGACAQLV